MYAAALTLTGTSSLPFFQLLTIPHVPFIQPFGVVVALGVVFGAVLLRRYGEWHGVSDDHIRSLEGWVMATGFLGAHLFDVIAYQWNDVVNDPILIVQIWKGISSYGGFIGGAMGFAFYVWWKRLPVRLFADMTIVGLLPAFSIGRIGCSIVSDHIGAMVDKTQWYAGLAMQYPSDLNTEVIRKLVKDNHWKEPTILAWNLGLIEFMYLVPVNALILWLAFLRKKRMPAGFVVALTGVLYAPVRFFLDFLRPEESDPRYASLTFAQWASFVAFGAACYAAFRVFQNGKVAEVIAPTSGEAMKKLQAEYERAAKEAEAAAKAKSAGAAKSDDKKSEK